jgi:hypothetical protein
VAVDAFAFMIVSLSVRVVVFTDKFSFKATRLSPLVDSGDRVRMNSRLLLGGVGPGRVIWMMGTAINITFSRIKIIVTMIMTSATTTTLL